MFIKYGRNTSKYFLLYKPYEPYTKDMETKHYIYIGIFVGSSAFGYLGSLIDHGNFFGFWSIFLSTVGGLLGIWIGYKLGNS